jgi:uncharacterized membrane protein YgdD (TMEM256/DUF423 family)
MRWVWTAGVFHALIGAAILFLTLHPLRDALDAHALDLARTGSAWQAIQGLVLMIVASATRARLAATLIAVGTLVSMAMLYFIIFTGERPPIIVLVPIGGAISFAGWISLSFARLKEGTAEGRKA